MITFRHHFCLTVVFAILALSFGSAAAEDDMPIRFRYAFVAFNPSPAGGELVPITQDTALASGDYFKFYIEKDAPCHIYLVYLSAEKEIHLLFPTNFSQGTPPPEVAVPYYVPHGKHWFRLDTNTGEERFYLLASSDRLIALEELFTGLATATDDADKDLLRVKIKGEIRRLRWENRNFQRAAERPVAIMGQLRGLPGNDMPPPQKVSDLATMISSQNFYSKAFTIDHR
ncbi:MAG: DUF4384 domain-containing protein [Pseudomonadota bacterium]